MAEVLPLVAAFGAGAGLGAFYFGGLWLTVKRLPSARRPGLTSLCSFFGRTGVTMLGFYVVMGGHWERLLVCLVGFLGARMIALRVWGPDKAETNVSRQ